MPERLLAAIVLLFSVGAAHAGDTLRCGSRIVAVEARAAEIIAACGPPDFRDVLSLHESTSPVDIADLEQWTYNFGSNQLLRVLTLRNGMLADIQADGYGFARGRGGRCSPGTLVEGLSKYRMVSRCGDPVTRRTISYTRPYRPRRGWGEGRFPSRRDRFVEDVVREEWVYNFGSQFPLKVVILEQGAIVDVSNGERGFD